MSFYSPIDRLAQTLPRPKGTGSEFMTELSKMPGYKAQEAEDRGLQALVNLPKMERAQFLEALKAKRPVVPKVISNDGTDDPRYLTREERLYGGNENQAFHEQYTLPGGRNYREILLQHPQGGFKGVQHHFGGTPNILASVRAKDRTGPNGEKILHIEELQSDWHQQGREKGYASPETADRIKAAERAHRELKQQLQEAKQSAAYAEAGLSDPTTKRMRDLNPEMNQRLEAAKIRHNDAIMELMPQVMKAEAAHQDLLHQSKNTVPDAPFKKNWHEMALKKMIHHAAANGYDSIAITPGREQADRYGMAKHIGRIAHMANFDNPSTGLLIAYDPKGYKVFTKDDVPHEKLAEYIGKEGVQKLMEQKPDEDGYRELSGQDLHVGGEGMKGFYDKIVPNFLNQFGKKYGAKVGQVRIPGDPSQRGDASEALGLAGERLADMTPEQATAFNQKLDDHNAKTLHHFPITPEMREDVTKNGVPLYAKGGSVEDEEPKKTVKAYKMFRVDKKQPGKLFPLFVDSNTPVEMDKWITAKEGERSTANTKKVKSKIGDLAYRPGWHAGDLPIATHIGDKDEEQKAEARRVRELRDAYAATMASTKAAKALARKEHPYPSWVNAPRLRNPNHIWAEVEMPDDVDWQSEATKRGYNDQGKLIASQAHITDQLPLGGHYRYKTNSNMLGNWLIGGSMKVKRILHDKEVEAINKAAGAADLPRAKAMNQKSFGFAKGGTVGPDEWMAEEHVNHMADGGPVPPLRPLNPQLAAAREQMAAQSALHKAYDEAMKNVYTNQMPTFAQWVASQGKAKGGAVKPVGYTKEQVTVSPNLDAMRYELESVKHYTKKVK